MSCPHGHAAYSACSYSECQKKAGMAVASVPQIHQSELNRLVEQLADLRRALRPFAEFGAALPPVVVGKPRLTDSGAAFTCKSVCDPLGPERVITFTDLRHAKALLERLETQDEERFIARIERKMAGVSDSCIALDCGKPIPGSESYHLAGYCSQRCAEVALRRPWKDPAGP